MKGDIYEVDQLIRVKVNSDLEWVYPSKPIFDEIDFNQVLCSTNGKRCC